MKLHTCICRNCPHRKKKRSSKTMSLDESGSTSSALSAYRDQVEQWIRAQHKLASNQPIPDSLQAKYMINVLRDCCCDENEENEQQELRRAVDDFQKIVLAKLPNATDFAGQDMILAPCRKPDRHAQPCVCPFLWFTVRRYPNGFSGAAVCQDEEVLSDGES